MSKFITFAITLIAIVTMASPATASSGGWSSDSGDGYVKVSADRKHITVCDSQPDRTSVYAEYATSYLAIHTVKDERGGDFGCGKDTVFFGRITVFKLCSLTDGIRRSCNDSIWIER